MDLEVIERGLDDGVSPPLVFIHGYWQAAWCWDVHVMPELAQRGYHCLALSLTGHGSSPGMIRGRSITDHVDDVVNVVSRLDRSPVLIGHSMGGFVAQHYLGAGHPAAGAVLVAPVPRSGAWKATFKTVGSHPGKFAKANLTLDIGPIVETPELAHEILFGPGVSREQADAFFDRWERASYRTYLDLLLKRPRPLGGRTPMLVVGGDHDWLFDVSEWERTASDHGAEMVVIEGAGHQVMLEPGWERLVELIDGFVDGIKSGAS